METKDIYMINNKEYGKNTEVTQMKTKVIERLVNGGFEAPIQRRMDIDEYQGLLERALDGEKYSQDEYLTRFRMVVGEVSEELLEDLRLCMRLQGWEGIEEFLDRLHIRVDVFVEEVEDLLFDHIREGLPTMEELVEVELEDLGFEENPEAGELVFRFWAPGYGAEPIAEFTCRDPEARADYVLTDVEALVAASWIPELREIVEDTLHDPKTKEAK